MIMSKYATLSPCGKFRYMLVRRWGAGAALVFVMLNPSKADALLDDPTVRKVVGFAKANGYECVIVLNANAYRATDPKEMLAQSDPVGPDNYMHMNAVFNRHRWVVVAWGANIQRDKADVVLEMLARRGITPLCLHITKDGHPGHPLMLSYSNPLKPFPGYGPQL